MDSKMLVSREELLGGRLSGRSSKQASTLLALIENRTAQLIAESQQAAARFVPLITVQARNQAFLEALDNISLWPILARWSSCVSVGTG